MNSSLFPHPRSGTELAPQRFYVGVADRPDERFIVVFKLDNRNPSCGERSPD